MLEYHTIITINHARTLKSTLSEQVVVLRRIEVIVVVVDSSSSVWADGVLILCRTSTYGT